MKFGLYVIPSSTMVFRLMDGEWGALFPASYHNRTPEDTWKILSSAPGGHCDGNVICAHDKLQCLTASRPVAKILYGVPDDVELYSDRPAKEEIYGA